MRPPSMTRRQPIASLDGTTFGADDRRCAPLRTLDGDVDERRKRRGRAEGQEDARGVDASRRDSRDGSILAATPSGEASGSTIGGSPWFGSGADRDRRSRHLRGGPRRTETPRCCDKNMCTLHANNAREFIRLEGATSLVRKCATRRSQRRALFGCAKIQGATRPPRRGLDRAPQPSAPKHGTAYSSAVEWQALAAHLGCDTAHRLNLADLDINVGTVARCRASVARRWAARPFDRRDACPRRRSDPRAYGRRCDGQRRLGRLDPRPSKAGGPGARHPHARRRRPALRCPTGSRGYLHGVHEPRRLDACLGRC